MSDVDIVGGEESYRKPHGPTKVIVSHKGNRTYRSVLYERALPRRVRRAYGGSVPEFMPMPGLPAILMPLQTEYARAMAEMLISIIRVEETNFETQSTEHFTFDPFFRGRWTGFRRKSI